MIVSEMSTPPEKEVFKVKNDLFIEKDPGLSVWAATAILNSW